MYNQNFIARSMTLSHKQISDMATVLVFWTYSQNYL